jgi:hypothetical protein
MLPILRSRRIQPFQKLTTLITLRHGLSSSVDHDNISRRIAFFLKIAQKSKVNNNLEMIRSKISCHNRAMTSREVHDILSNLYGMNDGDLITKTISSDLTSHLSQYGVGQTSPNDLGLIFRSLSSMSGKSIEIQELHKQLRRLIPPKPSLFSRALSDTNSFPLPIKTMIDIYASLTSMSSHVGSYQLLLESLYPHLQAQSQHLTFAECSDLLYCFQSSNHYSGTLPDTIKVIFHRMNELHSSLEEINSSKEILPLLPSQRMSIHQISKCMFGLKNIPNHFHEIKSIFQILASELAANRSQPITIHEIHHIISCLHGPHINIYKQEFKSLTTLFCELIEYNYVDMTEFPFNSPFLPSQLHHFDSNHDSHSSEISIFSYGPYLTDIFSSFYNQTSDNHLTQNLLLSLNTILLKHESSSSSKKPSPRYYLTPQQIGSCLSGMRNLSCDHNGVSEVMRSLSFYMTKSMNNPLNPKEIYPVHSYLTGQAISNCLRGMGSMSDENAAVKQMLLAIHEKMRFFGSEIQFTPTQICQSLNGFRGMTSKYQKITQIIDILIKKTEELNLQLPSSIPSPLSSKHHTTTSSPHLPPPSPTSPSVRFTGNDISLAFAGIQRMVPTESFPNLLKLVNILLSHGKYLIPEMSFSSLQITFTSLTHMISRYLPLPLTFMESLLFHLFAHIQALPRSSPHRHSGVRVAGGGGGGGSSEHEDLNRIILFQSLHLFKSQISNISSDGNTNLPVIPPSLLSTLNTMITKLTPSIPKRETQNIESKYENKIFNRLQGLFRSYSNIQFMRHQIVHGFSTDILLKIGSQGDKQIRDRDSEEEEEGREVAEVSRRFLGSIRPIDGGSLSTPTHSPVPFYILSGDESLYNIEIDGPTHDIAKKQFFYERRDGYFQEVLGIKVIRLSLKDCGFQSGAKLDHFLRNVLLENIDYEKLYKKY